MILQALIDYYEAMAEQGKTARPGWAKGKVAWGAELGTDGTLKNMYPLRSQTMDGKKTIPREMEIPAPVKRSSGVAAQFLCDYISYIFGIERKAKADSTAKKTKSERTTKKANPERAKECFNTAKELHERILQGIDSPAANAICAFFEGWDPGKADTVPAFTQYKEELLKGENIVFYYDGRPCTEDPAIRKAWQESYDNVAEGSQMTCLITGKKTVPELIHPAVKNVRGAQSSGAALVSFNAQAFCSYGKNQNQNAPVSKYAAFAYTSALNTLLADRKRVKQIGDTTLVYWAENAAGEYQDLFAVLLDGGGEEISDDTLDSIMRAISSGENYDYKGISVHADNQFYILGISPNAARLSVRVFYHNSFGSFVKHIEQHYRDTEIVADNRNKKLFIPLWMLLRETVNAKASDKTPLPQLSGNVLDSVLNGSRYPETLMNQVMLRIRAEHDVSRGRAAIIKAYLIRNTQNYKNRDSLKEVATVSLNPESNYEPYVLGRLFSVLEGLQMKANPGINATIKDRFFNSACGTPATVFPVLLKLSNSHLKKLDAGSEVYWSKQIGDLMNKLCFNFSAHLSLQEQGAFILGYYHQTQKRFEKKTDNKKEEEA